MKKCRVEDMMRAVRVAIDENSTSDALAELNDVDTLSLDDIIRSKLEDAARVVELEAPLYLLGSGEPFGQSIRWKSREGYGMGSICLPDDFLRLVTFQMSDWSRAVTVAIGEDDPLYELQGSRYAGIRGNAQKPVVAITVQAIGLVLEFYSCEGGEGVFVRRARYIPVPRVADGVMCICERLESAIVYRAASMVALSVKDKELADAMLSMSKELMNG